MATDITLKQLKKIFKSVNPAGLLSSFAEYDPERISFAVYRDDTVFVRTGKSAGSLMEFSIDAGAAGQCTLAMSYPDDMENRAEWLGSIARATLQELLDKELAVKAVSAETLAAYRELALFQRLSEKLTHSLEASEIARVLLEEAGQDYDNGEIGGVFLYTPKGFEMLACMGESSYKTFNFFISESVITIFRQIDKVQIINDFELSTYFDKCLESYMSVMVTPFYEGDKYLGFMLFASKQKDYFISADKKRMEIIHPIASSALNNAVRFDEQRELFNSFVSAIATAIDSKSPYTAGHCKRVPWIVNELVLAANSSETGCFKEFQLTDEEIEELNVAALLHDCGKISTPEWVMDKAVKLEGITDGIDIIKLKFEILKYSELVSILRSSNGNKPDMDSFERCLKKCENDLAFLVNLNQGGERLDDSAASKLEELSMVDVPLASGGSIRLLSYDETDKLSIKRGTLTDAERKVIEDHVINSMMIMGEIKFPDNMKNVTALAGAHHEKPNGMGYPAGKTGFELDIKSMIIAVADIFEALTAEDRPYRAPMPVSRALEIMNYMANDNEIDKEIFSLLLSSGIHKKYATKFLPEHLTDI